MSIFIWWQGGSGRIINIIDQFIIYLFIKLFNNQKYDIFGKSVFFLYCFILQLN